MQSLDALACTVQFIPYSFNNVQHWFFDYCMYIQYIQPFDAVQIVTEHDCYARFVSGGETGLIMARPSSKRQTSFLSTLFLRFLLVRH